MFSGISDAYREKVTNPSDRKRGKERSEYIKGILDSVQEAQNAAKGEDEN